MESVTDYTLEVQGLSTSFKSEEGKKSAIRNISLKVKAGETLAIVGESGSGKSVTSLAIMALLQKDSAIIDAGKIIFDKDHKQLLDLSEEQMQDIRGREIAMIFQEPMTALNPLLKCGKQVTEILFRHLQLSKSKAKERCLALFEKVKLPDPERVFDAYPHELSGGQKQRVVIAIALACEPKLIIADEPTTALDVTVQKEILKLLADLQKEVQSALIFITHDLGVVQEIADRVLVMYQGDPIEEGPAEEILKHPKTAYTRGLLNCKPRLDKRLKKLPTVADFLEGDSVEEILKEVESSEERKERLEKVYSGKKILEVEGLTKSYERSLGLFKGKQKSFAVKEVSFDVYEGETLGLVGESGCGKSTLSRCVLQLIKDYSGTVKFQGKQLSSLTSSELRKTRKHLQIVFQDPYSSLNPKISIGQAILEVIQNFKLAENKEDAVNRVKELLEEVGLSKEHYSRYPHEFSGGQRQRIVIARTLAAKPRFIVCDESVSALDVSVQAQVLNLLNELKRKYALSFIFISHDLSVVKHMSDRIMVMNKGQIEELQDADLLFENSQSEYTRKLINAIPGEG